MKKKTKLNKIISNSLICFFTLVLFMLTTNCYLITYANEIKPFIDVNEKQWFYNNLMYASSYQIISGFSDGTFRPNDTLTKEQYIKMLVMIIDEDYNAVKYKNDSWFDPYLRRAKELKIVRESNKDSSFYKKAITREEVALYTYNAYNVFKSYERINEEEINVIPLIEEEILDYNTIKEEAKIAINVLYSNSIIRGYSDKTFKPKNILTRAESTSLIYQLKQARQKDIILGNVIEEK